MPLVHSGAFGGNLSTALRQSVLSDDRLPHKYRYMEIGQHDGAPRYRNPNNIFLFRHKLNRSKELGITRQTCLPENELAGEDIDWTRNTAAFALIQEVSGRLGMDFSRLVKTSLQTVNLDRQVRKGSLLVFQM